MNTIKRHIAAFLMLALLLTQTSIAYAQTTSVCSLGTIVYYLNGVNKPEESQVAFDARTLGEQIKSKNMVGYKETLYLYNPSDSLLFDVLSELASQMAARRNASIADTFVQVGLAAWGAVSGMSSEDQVEIRNKVATTILQYNLSTSFTVNGDTFTTAQLVTKFKNTVSEQIRNGNKVVIVAHSQGNMFANDTYTAIKAGLPVNQSQGLAVANIGNAAAIASSGLYVTVKQDLVINVAARLLAVSTLAAQPMLANFDATGALDIDSTGHGFTQVYLSHALPTGTSDANSLASKTLALIQQAMNIAIDPTRTTSDGPITATMTWPNLGDVDLHTYEPNGAHVWYKNKMGSMGELDLDNRQGYGPEHYYTSCSRNLDVGRYTFAANYYSDSYNVGPQQVTIEIKTLAGTQTLTTVLPAAQFDNGTPTKMFDVLVSKTPSGVYSFVTSKL